MSNYLIELSIVHITFILGYWLFLRKERQYSLLRYYLIGTTFLALIIPLLKLPKLLFNNDATIDILATEGVLQTITITADSYGYNFWSLDTLLWVYLFVSLFFLFRFMGNLIYLILLERNSSYEKFNDLYIRKAQNVKGSFTFFNWIFLNDDIDRNQEDYAMIVKHEKAHASLGHTYDLVLFELFNVCFWWLPSTWYINNEIKKIHEYQADAYALKSYDIDEYSSILISSTLKTNGLSLASSFHDGLILKRLKAMKQKTKNVSPWKIGALSAIGALLFIVLACSEDLNSASDEIPTVTEEPTREIFTKVEEQPEFEGGMDGFYKYIASEMKYPLQARKLGVEGEVIVEFTVEKDGSISDVKAVKGIGAGCDGEAIRVVKSAPAFKPGKQRGKAVSVQMTLPISFKLSGKLNTDNSAQGTIIIEEIDTQKGKLQVEASYNNGEWSGVIYDQQKKALPGVNIVVAGTKYGTVSDFDGKFSVKADKSQELHISFIGYQGVKVMN